MQAIPSGNDYFLTEIAADWAGQPWQIKEVRPCLKVTIT